MRLNYQLLLIILLLLPVSEIAYAQPNLEDCRKLSRICVSANHTRVIDGIDSKADCWEWKTNYDCKRPNIINDECKELKEHLACTQISQECVEEKEGVCLRYKIKWHCTEKLPESEHIELISETYKIIQDRFDHACDTLTNRTDCRQEKVECVEGHRIENIKGLEVERDCWAQKQDFTCLSTAFTDDCTSLQEREDCTLSSNRCLEQQNSGLCVHEERHYECEATPTSVLQTCGSQNWCVNATCIEEQKPEPNQNFGQAAAMMSLLQEMGKDFTRTSADEITIFSGTAKSCNKWVLGLKNCCSDSGLLIDNALAECSESEKQLATQQQSGHAHYVSTYCSKKTISGVCIRRTRNFCTFNSRLARILQEYAHHQLGIPWSHACRGLTSDELTKMDWTGLDLSEILGDIANRMTTPEKNALKADLKQRIKNFYDKHKPTQVDEDLEEDEES